MTKSKWNPLSLWIKNVFILCAVVVWKHQKTFISLLKCQCSVWTCLKGTPRWWGWQFPLRSNITGPTKLKHSVHTQWLQNANGYKRWRWSWNVYLHVYVWLHDSTTSQPNNDSVCKVRKKRLSWELSTHVSCTPATRRSLRDRCESRGRGHVWKGWG